MGSCTGWVSLLFRKSRATGQCKIFRTRIITVVFTRNMLVFFFFEFDDEGNDYHDCDCDDDGGY